MHLVGVDIGFSEQRRSNGIAVLRDGRLIRAERLSVSERDAALRELRDVDAIAIDAPLLPPGTADTLPRHCERVFSVGLFQKRCKPGMSHIRGTGQRLREHGRRAAEQLLVARSFRPSTQPLQRVWPDAPIVEAFPNAFLASPCRTTTTSPRRRSSAAESSIGSTTAGSIAACFDMWSL